MSYLFCASSFDYSGRRYCNTAAASFNDDITAWDTSGVTDMKYMFKGASAFDQDLSGWSVAKVTSMYATFNGAAAFDQPIGGWRRRGHEHEGDVPQRGVVQSAARRLERRRGQGPKLDV